MPDYILRDIDQELWDRVKQRADTDHQSLRWILMQLIDLYAHGHFAVNAPAATITVRKAVK